MNKKERKQKLISDITKTFQATIISLTYVVFLMTTGFNTWLFAIGMWEFSMTNPLLVGLFVSNLLLFGHLWCSYIDFWEKLE